ncbi:MAG TPA: hypothetical protein VEA63_15600 [Opitutus sp.]|nr:hypothetical protein [Opitutus sp.]
MSSARRATLRRTVAVEAGMTTKDYKAILSAVEQAIAICDSYGDRIDDMKRKLCEDLRQARTELRRQLDQSPLTGSS